MWRVYYSQISYRNTHRQIEPGTTWEMWPRQSLKIEIVLINNKSDHDCILLLNFLIILIPVHIFSLCYMMEINACVFKTFYVIWNKLLFNYLDKLFPLNICSWWNLLWWVKVPIYFVFKPNDALRQFLDFSQ